MPKHNRPLLAAAIAATITNCANADIDINTGQQPIEEVNVISERLFADTTRVSPTSKINAQELQSINLITAEDAVSYEPSLVVRRRYVGDPNGVVGIRGSGMFQTARSLVFADGLPLHYLLQTRWSGSPRWSLVGPNEIESAEVIYGPYSAEYSGNAMGGVVDLKTKTPTKRKFTVQGNLMRQDYDHLGTDDHYDGNKLFVSYEDKIGDLAVFASYNRLRNHSQPMTNYRLDAGDAAALDAAGVSGYIRGKDDSGNDVIYIGDSGTEVSTSELYKLKLNYDLGTVQLRGTIAYEDRTREEQDKNNYLRDATGNIYWNAGNRNFEEREHERNSLLLGFGISGEINSDWYYDVYATDFEIKKDEETRSGLNTDDPAFGSRNGRLTKYGDTGWNTFDAKLGTDNLFGNEDMRLSVGYYFDHYELAIAPSNIDATTGDFVSARSESRGETSTQALFAQWGWALNQHWDLALGVRYEDWETDKGFYDGHDADDRSETGTSPKLSLAYAPNDLWSFRYSIAKALRFPIAEELYRNDEAATSIIVADASLKPEKGIHH
ncbi:MAG: TonB-dependent receptor, partial [Pseudomonadota bacterium]|nr:TonB-dependent receptor [Pseudomonadota bacterium]